ncbi:MAG: DUF2335 domain-containing protein [Rickettsiales bacterium]|nr:DUF2335 domain-containing protein [Rickettsiales bacterium]
MNTQNKPQGNKGNNPRRGNNNRTESAGGRQNRNRRPRKKAEVLPDPEVLEAYDYVVEGSAKEIIEMFKTEQAHRHQWERRALRIHMMSTVIGQVLGFLIAIAIFVSAAVIGIHGDSTIGAFIWVFGMAIITMAALVWWYAKSLGQRPLFARPALRSSFRAEKDKS